MLRLRWKAETTVPVEAECLRPDLLAGKGADEIRRLPVQHGNRQEPLGEFFDVTGDSSDEHIAVEGDCSRVKLIGAEMTRGRVTVEGNAGMHLGAEMRGGEIEVRGNAGDWVGAEMHGGLIRVRGDAGHQVGAAYRGSRRGMTHGTIVIGGRAGNEIGHTMRRGLIAVGGGCGDFAGVNMIAGTIFVFGEPGIRPGAGMRRGTIVLGDGTPESSDHSRPQDSRAALLATFRYACTYRPVFLELYLAELERLGLSVAPTLRARLFHRYSGDLVELGKGEILLPATQ